jgi:hypothetical protein
METVDSAWDADEEMVTAGGTLLRRLAVMLQGNDGELAK